MEGIEFEKENIAYRPLAKPEAKVPWMHRMVMKLSGGKVKDIEQSRKILVIVAIILFLLSIYNFFF